MAYCKVFRSWSLAVFTLDAQTGRQSAENQCEHTFLQDLAPEVDQGARTEAVNREF